MKQIPPVEFKRLSPLRSAAARLRSRIGHVVLLTLISGAAIAGDPQPEAKETQRWKTTKEAAWNTDQDSTNVGTTERPARLPQVAEAKNIQKRNDAPVASPAPITKPPGLMRMAGFVLPPKQQTMEGKQAADKPKPAAQTRWQKLEPKVVPQARVTPSQQWLPTTSDRAKQKTARRLLAQASHEYDIHAWSSAETTAWEALSHAAESIDLELASQQRGGPGKPITVSATSHLQQAREAIREARDFQLANHSDANAVVRIARSHRSKILNESTMNRLSATQAADAYLDFARVHLAEIARYRLEAAQAMDLLAAIHLSRAEESRLPSATALCLRRAALQGQPKNASLASRLGMHLADVGLLKESQWALEHSMSLRSDPVVAQALADVYRRSGQGFRAERMIAHQQQQRSQRLAPAEQRSPVPQIQQLTPEEFAKVSRPVMPARQGSANTTPSPVPTIASLVEPTPTADSSEEPGMFKRFFGSMRSVW